MVLDNCKLRGEPPLGLVGVRRGCWVAFLELRVAELCQGQGSGQTVGAVEVGEAVAQIAGEIERPAALGDRERRSEEHTSELQSRLHLVCRLLLEKKKIKNAQVRRMAESIRRIPQSVGWRHGRCI